MLDNLNLENVLIFDIETVPQSGDFDHLSEEMKLMWEQKSRKFLREDEPLAENYFDRAGIFAEFGKIVCISAGYFKKNEADQKLHFRIKSFASENELQVLTGFKDLLDKYYSDPAKYSLSGHNLCEFDVPYLCRRMLVNGLNLPQILDLSGKKPWEVNHIDTLRLWKFGDVKNYTSLKLLALIFKIPTPKDDIDGSDVGRVFWQEKDLQRITTYCQKDVVTVAQLLLKFKGLPVLQDEDIFFANGMF